MVSGSRCSSEFFDRFLHGEATSALNREFRDTEAKTANSLRVGPIGRFTAINVVFDLDIIYIVPASKWDEHKNDGQCNLVNSAKGAIRARYGWGVSIVSELRGYDL
ncbi:hypothetical protein [uncultured Ruegeria sp.]|uniref:SMODS domain-containing nucleotidyltransferase n=1 Tax=uncultured Ruegeria sp. TaxID=259304 RepID=UPI00263045B7|nr:hypothetical protein [uncultured Ruegeria sp.]